MSVFSILRPSVALIVVALAAIGCGEGDKSVTNDTGSNGDGAVTARTAEEVIRQAAVVVEDVETLRAEMTMEMDFVGETMEIDADMQMEGTRAAMTMRMFGERMEMLLDAPNFYMHVPGEGWFRLDGAAAGIDMSQFEHMVEDTGLVNLDALADLQEQNFEELPGESINGEAHRRFRARLTFQELADLNPDAGNLLTEESAALLEDIDGSVLIDVWVSDLTGVPTRTAMDMDYDVMGMSFAMKMQFDIVEINGDVDIPEPPVDARDFSELSGF